MKCSAILVRHSPAEIHRPAALRAAENASAITAETRGGSPDLELAPRAHPRLFALLQLPAQRDAGKVLGAIDPFADRVLVRVSRDEPGLLVGDAPALYRVAEPRNFVEPPLERRALRDRSNAHPEALAAVVFER